MEHVSNCEVVRLLQHLLEFLGFEEQSAEIREIVLRFLLETFPEWRENVRNTVINGAAWGIARLEEARDAIVSTLRENREFVSAISSFAIKHYGRDCVVKVGTKYLGRSILKGAQFYAIPFDVAQGLLEYNGKKEIGKKVGMLGNMGTAAAAGFMVGGPVGAAGGALTGAVLWLTGEVAGNCIDKWFS